MIARRRRIQRRGGVVVEFAIVAPIVLALILGIIDVAYTLTVRTLLEGSAREASRAGITGYTPADTTRRELIVNIVERQTVGLVNMARLDIDTRAYKAFDNIGRPEPFEDANNNGQYDAGETYSDVNGNGSWDADMGEPDAGGSGDVVVYTLTYEQPVLIPFMAAIYGRDRIQHEARAVVRNEPF